MDRGGDKLATVFGASGFLGTQVVQALARAGYRIRAASRRPDLAGHLRPLGDVGQIVPVQANIRNADSVMRAAAGADLVVNLVGVLFERGAQRFEAVQADGARHAALAARATGARLVHVSAIGAAPDSPSAYARSKAAGEDAVLATVSDAVVLRPSILFGPGDDFFNRFAGMARLFPALPLIAPETRFQPVFVGDVADAVTRAAAGAVRGGRIYELGGPEILSFRQALELILAETGRTRPLLPVPMPLARLLALPLEVLPKPPLTRDQLAQLGVDNVVSEAARREKRTLAAFGISPTSLEAELPTYLWRFRRNGQFDSVAA